MNKSLKPILPPSSIFGPCALAWLRFWVLIYRAPWVLAALASFVVLAIAAIIVKVTTDPYEQPWWLYEYPGVVFFPCLILSGLALLLGRDEAKRIFASYDKRYFLRTNTTEAEYFEALLFEAQIDATRRFTSIPENGEETMFAHPENLRTEAYKQYEQAAIKVYRASWLRCHVKAYVARRLGLI